MENCTVPAVHDTSESWIAYFQANARSLLLIPWERGAELTDKERPLIARSVQIFQLGESSEGRHLYQRSREWAERNGDPNYPTAIRLFIAEEQRHAADLGRFLTLNGMALLERTFTDTVFRKLRRFAQLDMSISVLVTAEIIAKVYYTALREATRSTILRTLCDQILRDEEQHVRFQCERLAILRRGRSRAENFLRVGMQRFLFFGTCAVVWIGHRRAFRAGGYGLARFWSGLWAEFEMAASRMNPRAYRWNRATEITSSAVQIPA
jgi:hypothetical protein